jgi:DNA-binding MarR family transcriptional regulator
MNITEVTATRGELHLLEALNRADGRQYLPALRLAGKLDQVVQDTLWARTASALVRKGLLSRSRDVRGTVYQLTPFGREYMAAWVTGEDGVARWLPGVAKRLEAIRASLRAQNVSYGELAELQGLTAYIESGDTELLEAAGVPEGQGTA